MFLRNWDNLMLGNNFYSSAGDGEERVFGDRSISYVGANGIIKYENSDYYRGLKNADTKYIDIGAGMAERGEAAGVYHPDLLKGEVDYDDYDLSYRYTQVMECCQLLTQLLNSDLQPQPQPPLLSQPSLFQYPVPILQPVSSISSIPLISSLSNSSINLSDNVDCVLICPEFYVRLI